MQLKYFPTTILAIFLVCSLINAQTLTIQLQQNGPIFSPTVTGFLLSAGPVGGDLSGTFPDPTVAKVNGASVPANQPALGSNALGQLVPANAIPSNALAPSGVNPGTYGNALGIPVVTVGESGQITSITTVASGATTYQGAWNATTNNPALASGIGTQGFYYVVSTAGSTALDGLSVWNVGDWAIFDGAQWEKVEGSASESFTNLTTTNIAVTGLTGFMYANGLGNAIASTMIPYADISGTPTSLPPSGSAGGDLSGAYPNPSVVKVNSASVPVSSAYVGTNSDGQFVPAATPAPSAGSLEYVQTNPADGVSQDVSMFPGTAFTIEATQISFNSREGFATVAIQDEFNPSVSISAIDAGNGAVNITGDTVNLSSSNPIKIANGTSPQKFTNLAPATHPTEAVILSQMPLTLPPSGAASGDLCGSYPNPTVCLAHVTGGSLDGVAIGVNTPGVGGFTNVTATDGSHLGYTPTTADSGIVGSYYTYPGTNNFYAINVPSGGPGIFTFMGYTANMATPTTYLTMGATGAVFDIEVMAPTVPISTNNTDVATTAAVTAALPPSVNGTDGFSIPSIPANTCTTPHTFTAPSWWSATSLVSVTFTTILNGTSPGLAGLALKPTNISGTPGVELCNETPTTIEIGSALSYIYKLTP